MKRRSELSDWPEHLHCVFAQIGNAMAGGRLDPSTLAHLRETNHPTFNGARVSVRHLSGKEALPGGNRYEIAISGKDIDGLWWFRSGELEGLARESLTSPNVG